MAYTATGQGTFRSKGGSLSQKLGSEFAAIQDGIDDAKIKIVDLTASMVSSSSLAANGVDLASGSNATFYAVFIPPVNVTLINISIYITEAYAKDTTNAKIELKTESDTPVTLISYTLPTWGLVARAVTSEVPGTAQLAALAANTALNLVITSTGSSSGTGRAKVLLRYTVD